MCQLREKRTNLPVLRCNVTVFFVKTKIFRLRAKVLTTMTGKDCDQTRSVPEKLRHFRTEGIADLSQSKNGDICFARLYP